MTLADQPANLESSGGDIRSLVDHLIDAAIARRASDIHVDPTAEGCDVRLRIDGLLERFATHDSGTGRMLVTRLMVLAKLLTYRIDVPQEGRASVTMPSRPGATVELRIAVMPTTHGLRAAVRLPAELVQPRTLEELLLPANVLELLARFATSDAGMLVITGPAGSGKTTTIYALLEHIVARAPGVSVVALEDPVERNLPGVTQIEVSPFGQLTYERALRSILRQDPQVLMLGEIRDAATASLAVQAALSGHRLVCTLHASTPAGAIVRLLEMGIEPYQLTSALLGGVSQRLLRRRLADRYEGRVPVAECIGMDACLRQAILGRSDVDTIASIAAKQSGFRTLRQCADELVGRGLTDASELARVLGP